MKNKNSVPTEGGGILSKGGKVKSCGMPGLGKQLTFASAGFTVYAEKGTVGSNMNYSGSRIPQNRDKGPFSKKKVVRGFRRGKACVGKGNWTSMNASIAKRLFLKRIYVLQKHSAKEHLLSFKIYWLGWGGGKKEEIRRGVMWHKKLHYGV